MNSYIFEEYFITLKNRNLLKKLILSLSLISPLTFSAVPTIEGKTLIMEKQGIKFYADNPSVDFDELIRKKVIGVRAFIDNQKSNKLQLINYSFDCNSYSVLGFSLLFDKKTGKSSMAPPSVSCSPNSYTRVLPDTATSLYFDYACKNR